LILGDDQITSKGLILIDASADNKYLSNVEDFYCGNNFIIKSKNG
jgi:hypothetical protein